MAGPESKKNDLTKLYWLIFAAILGVATVMIAPYTGLPLIGQRFLGVMVFTVVIWATEAVSYPVSALLLIVLMTFAGVDQKTTYRQAFSASLTGFAGSVPIAVLAGTAFARVVESTGLGQRIIYTIMKIVAGTKATARADRVLAAMFIAEIPLAFMVPTSNGRTGIYLSLAEGLKSIFHFHPGDSHENINPFQKAAYIACGIIPAIMGGAFLTAGEATLLAGRLIEEGTKVPQYWTNTATYLFLPSLLMLAVGWFILKRAFPSNVDNIPLDFINNKLDELGSVTRNEKYVLIALFGAIVLWLTDQIHHFPAECILVLLAVVCFIPGVSPGNWKRDSKFIAWGAALVIAVATSFSTLLVKYGVIKLLADWIARFGVTSFVGLMLLMAVAMIFMRLGVASIGGATALFIPLSIVIGQDAGLTVSQIVALAWVTYAFCRAGYLLPQQGAPLITSYDYNFFSRVDLFQVGVPLTLATLVIYGLWAIFVLPSLV